jgi:hypothetical protein
MCSLPKFALAACVLVCGSWQMQGQVYPIAIRGGDILARRHLLINSFLPGPGVGFDGLNAEPHGITNFSGLVAMGYTSGTATDTAGHTYNIGTDIRVYQGDYVGAAPANGVRGGSVSAPTHGTFVLI